MSGIRDIVEISTLPNCRVVIRSISTVDEFHVDSAIRIIQERIARQIAQKIMESNSFFGIKLDKGILDVKGEIYCFTEDEIIAFGRSKFKQGLDHARGFMPV